MDGWHCVASPQTSETLHLLSHLRERGVLHLDVICRRKRPRAHGNAVMGQADEQTDFADEDGRKQAECGRAVGPTARTSCSLLLPLLAESVDPVAATTTPPTQHEKTAQTNRTRKAEAIAAANDAAAHD